MGYSGVFTVKNENNVSLGIDMDLSKNDGYNVMGEGTVGVQWEPDPTLSGPKSYGESYRRYEKRENIIESTQFQDRLLYS